jgi:hypothetical protein
MHSILKHAANVVRHAIRDVGTEAKRSSKWPGVEHAHLKAFPTCAACAGTKHLQVHHVRPFHLDQALELDPTNLITMCMAMGCDAHLLIGHGDNFKAAVLEVRDLAARALTARKAGDMVSVAAIEAHAKAIRQLTLASAG